MTSHANSQPRSPTTADADTAPGCALIVLIGILIVVVGFLLAVVIRVTNWWLSVI